MVIIYIMRTYSVAGTRRVLIVIITQTGTLVVWMYTYNNIVYI